MRVVVNQLAATGRMTGIGHYTMQTLRCLKAQAGADTIDAFPDGWLRKVPELLGHVRRRLEPKSNPNARPGKPVPPRRLASLRGQVMQNLRRANRLGWTRAFRAYVSSGGHQVYHEPNFIPFPCDLPTIATVHDLSVLKYPEWHPADRVAFFERNFHQGLARCQHYLAISEFGRQEIIDTLGIAPERVTTTYMGIRPGLRPMPRDEVAAALRRVELPERYLLYVGTIEPRKNVLTLLRAYCALPSSVRSRWPLLLVGGWGWNAGDVAEYLHDEARHRGVIHVGYLPEPYLAAVYNGARALFHPSRYEGFGLPPVEMMACGGAVIAGTAGAVVETVGDRAHLLDPDDVDGWRSAMSQVVRDDDWWYGLCDGVTEAARPFTWDRCASVTLDVYRTVGGERRVVSTPRRVYRRAG